jgi:WD40 repeat protein
LLATASSDQTVKLWSFPEGQLLHTLQDRKKTVAEVQISADGRWVAAASYGGRAVVWTPDGQPVVGIKARKKNLATLALSPDGQTLAVGGLGDAVQLWSLPAGEPVGTLSGHATAVSLLNYIDAGRTLVSLGYEGVIKFWDTATWREQRSLPVPAPSLRGLAFSADESIVALSLESKVQLRSADDWALQAELPVGTKVVSALAFSPDGRWFAAGAADRQVRVWEIA